MAQGGHRSGYKTTGYIPLVMLGSELMELAGDIGLELFP